MKPKVIAIVGPTAVGKSNYAVMLAKKINGEIISADSRQVYKELTLTSGKITHDEMDGVPHHLLDIVSVSDTFTISDFISRAQETIDAILTRGKVPIVCGGTFFYIDALLRGIHIPEVPPNPLLREILNTKDTSLLFSVLQKKDPARAEEIDPHNKVRIIRALEIIAALGAVPKKKIAVPYEVYFVGLTLPASVLEDAIKKRITDRIKKGMIEEVAHIPEARLLSLGLECREIAYYNNGTYKTIQEFEAQLFIKTKQFAKRQMTWLKRYDDIHWNPEEHDILKWLHSVIH